MHVYLAIKFYEDSKNRELIENITASLASVGIKTTVMTRDLADWGSIKFHPQKLMELSFQITDSADLLLVEFSEHGIGVSIEAGYAFARKIPIVVIAKHGSEIPETIQGIAKEIIFYSSPQEFSEKIKSHIESAKKLKTTEKYKAKLKNLIPRFHKKNG